MVGFGHGQGTKSSLHLHHELDIASPRHVFAALSLADNCKGWNGNREGNKPALPLAAGFLSLAKPVCNRSTIVSKTPKFRHEGMRCSAPLPTREPCQHRSCSPCLLKTLPKMCFSAPLCKGEQSQMAQGGQSLSMTGWWHSPAVPVQSPQILCVLSASDLPTIEDRFADRLRNKKTLSQIFHRRPTPRDTAGSNFWSDTCLYSPYPAPRQRERGFGWCLNKGFNIRTLRGL